MKFKKKYVYFGVIIIVIAVVTMLYFHFLNFTPGKTEQKNIKAYSSWFVDRYGYLNYPLNRSVIRFHRDNITQAQNSIISKIIYQSKYENIYGLLVLPKSTSVLLPGVVLLPGAGVSKESELPLAEKIAGLGTAVLTIDQRGVGETDGPVSNLDQDYASFIAGNDPFQHLLVYDALRAYDLLRSAPFVDPNNIIIVGESLGGRIAIIAAAIDPNIRGVLAISTSGFGFSGGNDSRKDAFINSIDPDHYIGLITPRKLVMMQNLNDKIIDVNSALNSYSKAENPKRFVLVNDTGCNHGYCDSMYPNLVDSLDYLVGINPKIDASSTVK